MKIFVGCSSSNNIPSQYKDDCKILLNQLFEKDNDLVFGACNLGIMGDSYNSALDNSRQIIGICPEAYKEDFKELKCTTEITTKTVSERTDNIINESDILLFLPGGIGTIYELFTSIESKRCHEHEKTIIIYNSLNYYDKLFSFLDKIYGENFTADYVKQNYFMSNDKEEILSYINTMRREKVKKR